MIEEMTYPGGTGVLVWRLEQEPEQLLELCRQDGIPTKDLENLPVKRLREKAVERLLLCCALGRPVILSHTQQGAPYIEGDDVNISITHTARLVALAWNRRNVIGIDAEQADRQQVVRVRDKFLNDSEHQFIRPDDQAAHVIAWTAKEAVIKVTRNSAIDWTEGIRLEPFESAGDEIDLTARCGGACYRLVARRVGDHYITVAAPA